MRAARRRLNLTLNTAAKLAGVDRSVLSKIETGERADVRLSTAVSLCRALGLSLDDVTGLNRRPSLLFAIGAEPFRGLAPPLHQ